MLDEAGLRPLEPSSSTVLANIEAIDPSHMVAAAKLTLGETLLERTTAVTYPGPAVIVRLPQGEERRGVQARRSCKTTAVLLLAGCVIAACGPSDSPQVAVLTAPPESSGGWTHAAAANEHDELGEAVVWPATEYGPVAPGTVSQRPATAVDEFGEGPPAIVVVGAEDGPIAPGTVVELRYPAAAPRGITHTLIRRTERSWQLAFQLGASEDPAVPSGAWALPGDEVTGPDIMLTGPGPLYARVPPPTPPGTYRICHTVGRCSDPFEIVDP